LAAKKSNISSVVSIHNTYSKKPKFHRRIFNWYLSKYTSAILVDSEDIKKDVVEFDHVSSRLVHIIPSAVNLDSINTRFTKNESRGALGINKNDFVLGTIGRLEEQKGHRFLLEALSILKKEKIYIKLIIIGDGRLRKDLEGLSKVLTLEKQVLFLGTRTDIADLFPAMDVFIMPSLWEGLSVAMLTAMAAGLPVIATNVGGVRGVLEKNFCGIVIEPGDASKLVQAIKTATESKSILEKYAYLGRAVVENKYSDISMAKSIYKIYREVINIK
jgi:glycosyltransferase involved in cell wall biosynthesis